MSRKSLSSLLLWLIVLLVASAAVTLLPHDSPHVNDMGYHSLCPFAPYSTGTLLFVAGLAWIVRAYLNSQREAL